MTLVRIALMIKLAMMGWVIGDKPRPEYRADLPGIVRVEPGRGMCSGFVVVPGVVFTARHCVDSKVEAGEHFINVHFLRGADQQFYIAGYGDNESRDFAILFGDTLGVEPLALAEAPAEVGVVCANVGYGGDSPTQNAVPCEVIGSEDGYIKMAANVIGGDSGSPVIDIDTGKVFGIAVRSGYPVPIALAVDIREVVRALKLLEAAREIAPPAPEAPRAK